MCVQKCKRCRRSNSGSQEHKAAFPAAVCTDDAGFNYVWCAFFSLPCLLKRCGNQKGKINTADPWTPPQAQFSGEHRRGCILFTSLWMPSNLRADSGCSNKRQHGRASVHGGARLLLFEKQLKPDLIVDPFNRLPFKWFTRWTRSSCRGSDVPTLPEVL